MNICVKVSFFNSENRIVDETFLDIDRTNNCVEIKFPINTTSMRICVSIIVINVNTCMNIKIYNHTNELIACDYLELHEFQLIHRNCEIPKNSMSMIICCINNYKPCEKCFI